MESFCDDAFIPQMLGSPSTIATTSYLLGCSPGRGPGAVVLQMTVVVDEEGTPEVPLRRGALNRPGGDKLGVSMSGQVPRRHTRCLRRSYIVDRALRRLNGGRIWGR